jgi:hypothetical protein
MGSGASRVGSSMPEPARKSKVTPAAVESAIAAVVAAIGALPPSVRGSVLFRAAAKCDVNLVAEATFAASKSMVGSSVCL